MRKLTLELESLEVESFETADAAGGRGTVAGHQLTTRTCFTWCPDFTCPECAYPDTDQWTCAGTCNNTCPDTCWETCGCGSGTGPDIQYPV
jgi:hypothetical protein